MQFPPKHYQVSLFLTRKEKLPKCQEIPRISAGGKKTLLLLPLVEVTEKVFQKLFSLQNGRFCFTGTV